MRLIDLGNSKVRMFAASMIVALCTTFAGSNANATPLPAVFTVSGTFDDGGTLSGQFGINVYGYIDDATVLLTTTAGTTLISGQVYTTPPNDRSIIPNSPLLATSLVWYNTDPTPYRELHLAFFQAINEAVQPDTFSPTTFLPLVLDLANSYECFSWNCPGPTGVGNNTRYLISANLEGGNNAAVETPLPGALPLFATGLGVLGFVARRRRRKVTAA